MSRPSAWLCACLLLPCCVLPMLAQQPAASATNSSNVAVPPLVNFGGVLTDLNGKPLTNITGVTFLLYKEEQGGAPLWMETQNVQPDKTGHYSVMLGSTTSTGLPADIFVAGEARWLGVQPQGQAEQARVMLLSVPYALKAADAQTVGGLPASAFVLAPPASPTGANLVSPSAAAQPLATGTTPVTTAGGTVNKLAKFDAAADITNSQIFDNGTNVGIGTTTPAAKLDVKGSSTVRGLFSLPQTGTATATAGYNSQAVKLTASVFNSGTGTAVAQNFQLQTEPAGNNTSSTSGTLNLLYSTGTNKLAETGLKIASNGQLMFAAGQTFPGTGNGTVTSVGLTAPSTEFLVTGSPVTGSGTLGLGWLVAPDPNNTPNAIVKRDSSGNFSAGTITAASGFNIGSNLFAFGSYANGNAFLGFSGNASATGSGNTASGQAALQSNTTGSFNTATGASALYNSTGDENTAHGFQALYANTTGNNNTASGFNSLYLNTTGMGNTAIGYGALTNNTTGNNNTALGNFAGPDHNSPNLSNATAIGYNAVVSQSNALVLGGTGSNAVNVGIGTATPAYTLDVQGSGRFTQPIVFASSQTFPGTGTITGVSAGSGLSGGGTNGNVTLANTGLLSLTAGTGITVSGGQTPTVGINTSTVPQLSAANTFTSNQTVNGNLSATGVVTGSGYQIGSNLFAYGSSAIENAFLGFAGNNSMTGDLNTGVGYEALYANTTGASNTANGAQALISNTTGNANTAAGSRTLLFNNSGGDNTAIGSQALISNTTGSWNTASGGDALSANQTGSYNTALGWDANVGPGGLSNATAIGAASYVTQSNTLVLGCVAGVNSCPGAVKVGIGTTAPDNMLTVNGSADKPGGGSWGTYSDRRLKTVEGNFNSGLSQILKLRPVLYRYNKENAMGIRDSEQHVGLVAQEVQAVIPEAVTENSKGYLLVNNDPILWSMLNAIKEQQTLIHKQQEQIKLLARQMKTIQATLRANGRGGSEVRTVKAAGTAVHQ